MKRIIGFGERHSNVRKQLSILIQLAKIDRDFGQEEKSFIKDFGRRFNINRSELEEIERNPENIRNIAMLNQDDKVELLYNTVRLAKVDKKILPNEIVYCQEIASRLGFRRSVIDAILPLVSDKQIEQINYARIRRKIAPFL